MLFQTSVTYFILCNKKLIYEEYFEHFFNIIVNKD